MKVVHISATDNAGGAAKAAFRIHTGLLSLGVDSRMLVGLKTEKDRPEIEAVPLQSGFPRLAHRVLRRLEQATGLEYQTLPWARWFLKHPFLRDADVVHLHNLHGGFFPMRALGGLAGRPVVWSAHDLWPITGHCYFPGMAECERWKTGCGKCPALRQDNYYPLSVDTTPFLWRKKRRLYESLKPVMAAQSTWTEAQIGESPLLSGFRRALIPYAVDTDLFRPGDRGEARRSFRIPEEATALFFSAVSLSSQRKGWAYLAEALREVRPRLQGNVVLVTAGGDPLPEDINRAYSAIHLGFIRNERVLASAYAAADVFVGASLMETFGQVFAEAMACGVPQVAFATSGVSDVIRHGETGYLARFKDVQDLGRGIETLVNDPDLRRKMGARGREIAEAEYPLRVQAERFAALYREIAAAGAPA